ncbi:MAG: hypothetical protein IKO68_00060 [Oscillospiraceae bacterium]|nr:hypothetical protein [Oscillospiraceae bacterium]MBR4654988.1 hypothetical protein [Oscillospiraceae bacterium]
MSALLSAIIAGRMRGGSSDSGDYERKSIKEVISGTDVTITPQDNHEYFCESTLTSLTITNPNTEGYWIIFFETGNTLPTVTIPASVKFPINKNLDLEKNAVHELHVWYGRALYQAWPVDD